MLPRHRLNRIGKHWGLEPGPRAEPEAHQELRRQQRDEVTGGAIDLHQVAPFEILDPRQVEGQDRGASVFPEF
jgi:hypothetical protein